MICSAAGRHVNKILTSNRTLFTDWLRVPGIKLQYSQLPVDTGTSLQNQTLAADVLLHEPCISARRWPHFAAIRCKRSVSVIFKLRVCDYGLGLCVCYVYKSSNLYSFAQPTLCVLERWR